MSEIPEEYEERLPLFKKLREGVMKSLRHVIDQSRMLVRNYDFGKSFLCSFASKQMSEERVKVLLDEIFRR